MGALPNTLPATQKKSPARASRPAKLNQYGRDPGSPSERMRASSDYDTEKGYSPFFHAFLSDIPRLTSGNSCTLLLMTLFAKSAGRGAQKGKPRPEWTLALSVSDLAQICRCDERTIERELKAMGTRGLAEVKSEGKGMISARLKYRDWEALPDYKLAVIEMPATDDAETDPEKVDESKHGNQRVTGKKAVRLLAGALSRAFPVSCGVKAFRYKADGPIDLDITAVIQAGELVVTSRLPESWAQKLANLKTSSHVSNELDYPSRHGRRGDERGQAGGNAGTRTRRSDVEPGPQHPRAQELMQLFDPLLGKSGAVLLDMDQASLRAACEAIADCDHDHLVKFAVNRASSPIRKPSYVAIICKEALASWRASKLLDASGAKHYCREEIDEMVKKERAELARKREELRRRK